MSGRDESHVSKSQQSLGLSDLEAFLRARRRWRHLVRKKMRQVARDKLQGNVDCEAKLSRIRSATGKGRLFKSLENAPLVPSQYDDKLRQYILSNPTLVTNRVHVSWYRRFSDVLPEREQTNHQPFREIQSRDEDIALQHQFGHHECMHDLTFKGSCKLSAQECKRIREIATSRYSRIKKRDEEKREKDLHFFEDPGVIPASAQDIDLTTEFGFSANKRKMVSPIVDFLTKLHINRERKMNRRSLKPGSRWRLLKTQRAHIYITEAVKILKRQQAHTRIRRLFNLVLCVDRFIKCVAMIAGDTQTLLKDITIVPPRNLVSSISEAKADREFAIFNVHHYQKVGQVQVPFHIQLILTKPWFCRSIKEVETAVNFLEKMRCFTAYPKQFQHVLARVAWYIELPTQKVIIRQCQEAVNFYLLLNGSVRIDRLEGSADETDSASFRTLKLLTSQDMFGDECITEPFSERWYTATSEEKCAVLDFNLHDYNGMIQTANTSEEAPDHIRFLCRLRILDHFPKIKLLTEQENNVTYFYFRPGTVVTASLKESPFIFIVRNGSCSVLAEIVPKDNSINTAPAPYPQQPSPVSRKSIGGTWLSAVIGKEIMEQRAKKERMSKASEEETITRYKNYNVYHGLKSKLKEEDKEWFERIKRDYQANKASLQEQVKGIVSKSSRIARNISSDILERYNLNVRKDSMMRQSESSIRISQSSSLLRWKIDGKEDQDVEDDDAEEVITRHSKSQLSAPAVTGSYDKSIDVRGKRSKIIGTNIPINSAALLHESSDPRQESDTNNSSKNRNSMVKRTSVKNGPEKKARFPQIPVKADPVKTGGRAAKLRPRPNANVPAAASLDKRISRNLRLAREQSHMLRQKYTTPSEQELPPCKYSQWTQKALLTVTDVAGLEWLDYNDGTYKAPTDDLSLVSHGATIIMVKKDFMLKYLKKVW